MVNVSESTLEFINHQRISEWSNIHPQSRLALSKDEYFEHKWGEVEKLTTKMNVDGIDFKSCGKVLDLGSGLGFLVLKLLELGADAKGIEPFEELVDVSRKLLSDTGHDPNSVSKGVGELMPFNDNSFDLIVSSSVIEHVQDVRMVISECNRVLKDGGILYLVFPNSMRFRESHYKSFFIPFMPKHLASLYFSARGRDGTFIHTLNYLTPRTVIEMLEYAGFKIVVSPIDEKINYVDERINNPKILRKRNTRIKAMVLKYTGLSRVLKTMYRYGLGISDNRIIACKQT